MKGFLFELAMKAAEERGYNFGPVGEYEPWTVDNYTQLCALNEFWQMGRELRNAIVKKRDSGQPFDEAESLLRHVHASCRAQLEAWQPTDRARRWPM